MEHLPEFIANHLFLVTLFIAILTLLLWNLFGNVVPGVMQVNPMEATRLLNHDNAVMIDLRGENDYSTGHILNAISIPAVKITEQGNSLNKYKERPVILYCNNGMDSLRVSRTLKQQGFEKLHYLKGGLQAWRSSNLPVTKD